MPLQKHPKRIFHFSMSFAASVAALSVFTLYRHAQSLPARRAFATSSQTLSQSTVTPNTPLYVRLAAAVQRGDAEEVRALLEQGASADARLVWQNQEGSAPVAILAAHDSSSERERYLPIFQLLIQRVTVPDAADAFGHTLLMAAIDMDDLTSVKQLVANGADVNAKTNRLFAGANALFFAAMQGGIRGKDPSPTTLFLLEHHAEVNVQDEQGTTPLIAAAQFGKIQTIKALLAHGANPSLRDKRGLTALHMAELRGHEEIVRLLRDVTTLSFHEAAQFGRAEQVLAGLKAGENPNGLNPQGQTPLIAAMQSGSMAVTKLLLAHGAEVRGRDRHGRTALHYAALYGDTAQVALLLDSGADVNAFAASTPPDNFATPLTCAVQQAQADVVDLLLRRGADLKQHEQGTLALELAIREAGQTPRRLRNAPSAPPRGDALLEGQGRIIERLLAAGADPRADNSRALYLAAGNMQIDLVSLLLQNGADVNGHQKFEKMGDTEDGQPPLLAALGAWGLTRFEQHALADGSLSGPTEQELDEKESIGRKLVKLLLAKGANVNAADSGGQTPLMACLSHNLLEPAKLLLRKGANVQAADRKGRTILMQAAADNKLEFAQLLLAHKADVNRRDNKGYTALMLAIDDGSNADYIDIRKSEDEHPHDAHGENPPPIARKDLPNPNGHPDMVRLLLQQHGINLNVIASDGNTALKLAQQNEFAQVVTLLQEAGAR